MEKGRETNNTWVSRVWEALKRDLSAGFAKNPLVVGWNLLMCVRKHLHHPGGGEWLPRAGAERGTRCSCRIPRPGISPRIPTRFPFSQRSQSIGAPCQEGPLGRGMSLQQPQHHVLVGKGAFFGPGCVGSSPSSQGRVPVCAFASFQPHPGEFGCSEAALKDRPHRGCEGVELGRVNQLPVA